MESLPREDKIATGRQKPSVVTKGRPSCSRQGLTRIFQQSIKGLSATPDSSKNLNSVFTASAKEMQSATASRSLMWDDHAQPCPTSVGLKEHSREEADKNVFCSDSRVLSKDPSFVPSESCLIAKMRTVKSLSSKVPHIGRGRGRGRLLERNNEVKNPGEPLSNRPQNSEPMGESERLAVSSERESDQASVMEAVPITERILQQDKSNISLMGSELPDLVKCQSSKKKLSEHDARVSFHVPQQTESVSNSRRDKRERRLDLAAAHMRATTKHQDYSSTDSEEVTKKKTSKHFGHDLKPSAQRANKKCKLQSVSQFKVVAEDKENPHRKQLKQKTGQTNATLSRNQASSQKPTSNHKLKSNKTFSLGISKKEIASEELDLNNSTNVQENIPEFEMKDSTASKLSRLQCEENEIDDGKPKNLDGEPPTLSFSHELNKEILEGSKSRNENVKSNAPNQFVNKMVSNLYNNVSKEMASDSQSSFAKHQKPVASSSMENKANENKLADGNQHYEMTPSKFDQQTDPPGKMTVRKETHGFGDKSCCNSILSKKVEQIKHLEVSQASTNVNEKKPDSLSEINEEGSFLRSMHEGEFFKNDNHYVENDFYVESEKMKRPKVNQTSNFLADRGKSAGCPQFSEVDMVNARGTQRICDSTLKIADPKGVSSENSFSKNCGRYDHAKHESEKHLRIKRKEDGNSWKGLQTQSVRTQWGDQFSKDYICSDVVDEMNDNFLNQEKFEDVVDRRKDSENVDGGAYHRDEGAVDVLPGIKKRMRHQLKDFNHNNATRVRISPQQFSNRKLSNFQTSNESFCALKLGNMSISDNTLNIDGENEMSRSEKGTEHAENNHLTEEENKHLSNIVEATNSLRSLESDHSSDLPASPNRATGSGSEPEMGNGSQSESEPFTSVASQNYHQSLSNSVRFSSGNPRLFQHPPNCSSTHGFSRPGDERFYQYAKQAFPPYSEFREAVQGLSMPVYQFSEKNVHISNFLRECSEKIAYKTSSCPDYLHCLATIRVELLYSGKPKTEVHSQFELPSYGNPQGPDHFPYSLRDFSHPLVPINFPHPHTIWTRPEHLREFQSAHMDASRAEARLYPQGHSQPVNCYQRCYHCTATCNPSVPGLNPGMYSSCACSSEHCIEMRRHKESQPLNKPHWNRNEALPGFIEASRSCDQSDVHNMKSSLNGYGHDKAKKNVINGIDRNSNSPKDETGKRTGRTSLERLNNSLESSDNLGSEADRHDLPPPLIRSLSNPDINVVHNNSTQRSKKRHSKSGHEAARQLHLQDEDLLDKPLNSPKMLKTMSSSTDVLTTLFDRDSKGKSNGIGVSDVSQIPLPSNPSKAPLGKLEWLGSNCSNWREQCRPLGTADPSLDAGLTPDPPRANIFQPRRQSGSALEIRRDAANNSKLSPATMTGGLKGRRSNPTSPQESEVTQARREKLLQEFKHKGRTYQLPFIDTHCHIDFLYSRLGTNFSTPFHTFRLKHPEFFPDTYEGCVAVFCNPKTFAYPNPHNAVLKTVEKEDDVWLALGCHPKNAEEFEERHLHGLSLALESPKVVALGETGLDYSGHFGKSAETQKRVFKLQLELALKKKLPVVIHCRDADDDCLEILQSVLPKEHKIHAHCFTRGFAMAQRWMDAFPNLWLGFTPLITYRTATDAIESAANIPLNRLLLETDAPYFVPGSLRDTNVQFSYPGFALFTAERIAYLKGITVTEVLKACRKNTKDMYNI
ncbi:hypothetical protein EGW08_016272 [Elysia chlorotica]|uniref:Uncharacterized protein n=1 Tax=Elysia chlorotica TaxID=188477 RepID=A0A3S0ZJ49_ELYCH|nr:hypothetical protein EGW08_016272 [Elysia chlorotica]